MTLVENDGQTLIPPLPQHVQSFPAIIQYLDALFSELKSGSDKWAGSGLFMLMECLRDDIYQTLTLQETDLRGIMLSRVQWLRLFGSLVGDSMRDRHSEEDGPHDVVPINIPYPLVSLYFEFLLFLVELTDPRLNMLTVPRRSYVMAHQQGLEAIPEPSPVQVISQITWRRHLMDDPEFLARADLLRTRMGETPWAYVAAGRVAHEDDWLVFFKEGDPSKERVADSSDERYRFARDFCFSHGLEMVGTYIGDCVDLGGLHVFPMRIHTSNTDWGVRVDIPFFYTPDHIERYMKEDFADFAAVLGIHESVPRNELFLGNEDQRRAGKLIGHVLTAAGHDKHYKWSAIKRIWMDVVGTSPRRILGGGNDPEPLSDSAEFLIRTIDSYVEEQNLSSEDRLLWAEFCRFAMFTGHYRPFEYAHV